MVVPARTPDEPIDGMLWLVFFSPRGVTTAAARLQIGGGGAGFGCRARLAAIGPTTAQALPRCDATAAAPTAEAIAAAIAAFDPRAGVEERTGDLVDVR
jgi:uroporphyrinogen-III synthase